MNDDTAQALNIHTSLIMIEHGATEICRHLVANEALLQNIAPHLMERRIKARSGAGIGVYVIKQVSIGYDGRIQTRGYKVNAKTGKPGSKLWNVDSLHRLSFLPGDDP